MNRAQSKKIVGEIHRDPTRQNLRNTENPVFLRLFKSKLHFAVPTIPMFAY